MIRIQILGPDDLGRFTELLRVFESVFELQSVNLPKSEDLRARLADEGFISVVAILGDRVIGGLTAYVLQQYFSIAPVVYLYDLGVAGPYQGQGVGGQLVNALQVHCRERGVRELFVQADRGDGQAIDFYRKTRPAREADVIHFTYSLA